MKAISIRQAFAATLMVASFSVFAAPTGTPPVERLQSYVKDGKSSDIPELGERILSEAVSTKYLVTQKGDPEHEWAYRFKRLSKSDWRWTGDPKAIEGLVIFEVSQFKAGCEVSSQLTYYRPSRYANSVLLVKMSRDEGPRIEFDLAIDSSDNLYWINGRGQAGYFEKSDELVRCVPAREKPNPVFF